MKLILDKIEQIRPNELVMKQFANDLSNAVQGAYNSKIKPTATGGKGGAGAFGGSFLDSLGLSGLAESYKANAEAKYQRGQDKEKFVKNFQDRTEAGQNLSLNTSREVAESMFDEIEKTAKELKELQDKMKDVQQQGFKAADEEKKREEELIKKLQELQPGKDRQEKAADQSLQQIQTDEKGIEQAEMAKQQFEVTQKGWEDVTDLYVITDDFFKKMDKRTEEMLDTLKIIAENGTGGGGGGVLSTLADAADLASAAKGNKGGGAAGKAASAAGKLGKFAKVGGGLLAVGTAAYEGYTGYQDAEEQVKRGEITKEEGQVKKGEAVGGAVGGGGGALAGAAAGAAIGSVVPVVGTAIGGLIGGAIGYWGGKKAGEAVGGAGVKGYQALNDNSNKAAAAGGVDQIGGEPVTPGKPLSPKQMEAAEKEMKAGKELSPTVKAAYNMTQAGVMDPSKVAGVSVEAPAVTAAPVPTPKPLPAVNGPAIKAATTEVANVRDAATSTGNTNNNMVNAPVTNVVNNNGSTEKAPIKTRNDDNTYNRYVDRRYFNQPAGSRL
jgi:cytoskeletal protein RodZ